MKVKRIKGKIAAAALLLALTLPPAAHGQSDGFFSNAGGVRSGNGGSWNSVNGSGNGGSWNSVSAGNNGVFWNGMNGGGNGGSWNDMNGDGGGASWHGMEDETPLGGGLLILAASGVCYAGAKRRKSRK